jgi:pyruvate dehydrogenase E1 component alpha subunit
MKSLAKRTLVST